MQASKKFRDMGYASRRAQNKRWIDQPSLPQWKMRQAISRCGLRLIALGHEVSDETGPLFFHAYTSAGMIDMDRDNRVPKRLVIRQRKRAWCKAHNIPYLVLQPSSVEDMQVEIERWRLGI